MARESTAPSRFLCALLALSVACLAQVVPAAPAARAGDMTPVSKTALTGETRSTLDGRVFEGEFGALGKEAKGSDGWVFDKGMFLSQSCLECGFPESPYRVRLENGKTHFETLTQCPRTDATISWRGTVEEGRIEGVFTWVRKRWYWTIEKQFWFRGTLVETPADETTASLH